MTQQENLATAEKFGAAINSGQFEQFRDLMTTGIVDHDPAPDQGPGADGFIGFFTTMKTAFPDLTVAVEHLVADEDNVAFACTLSGTHQGAFQGVAPTGKRVSARGMQIARFDNGKMAERWGSSDELGIMKQIGGVARVSTAT